MARGVNTAGHPGRKVDRGVVQEGGTASGYAAAGGGSNMPYNPNAAYLPVTGSPGRYYTPDRTMTVGIGTQAQTAPQSEQPGRGVMVPTADERLSQWFQENQPQYTNSFGPVAEVVNSTQFVPS